MKNFKEIRKESINALKEEELWDWICSRVGFDENGLEIQAAIRKFVALKLNSHFNALYAP